MKFSIITCTYNSREYLSDTINSVKSQTEKDFEHIFIDGGSTDGTLEMIDSYKKEFPEKVRRYQQKPQGISGAMNYGVEKSKGEIICHLHSDDLFCSKDVLRIASKVFSENKDLRWAYGKLEIINPDGSRYNLENPPEFSAKRLFSLNFIPHPATFVKRDFFNQLGGFSGYKYAMDYDLWLRASLLATPKKINHCISKFRRHPGGASTKWYLNTLKEDYMVRMQYTPKKMRLLFFMQYRFRVSKFILSKWLGRA